MQQFFEGLTGLFLTCSGALADRTSRKNSEKDGGYQDYVYFSGNPSQFSKPILEKTTACKLKIEHVSRKADEINVDKN
ncbi:Serine/threonine-protein kinase [Puccinia graminis f. sp. tritici]|uniref:Serine/threonine-protein kinase n=1 Tax=Puccinia graminis f. sp. tritici TaxID=56615 RepID=A0A5B0S1R9_PUCGR|nr:Serine/threonine-protein kinase [Puccinia graminis f. sp. tritici]